MVCTEPTSPLYQISGCAQCTCTLHLNWATTIWCGNCSFLDQNNLWGRCKLKNRSRFRNCYHEQVHVPRLCKAKIHCMHLQSMFYASKPGIANWVAKFSTHVRSSIISLLFWRPFGKAFCNFPCSLSTAHVICAALWRKPAIISKSPSRQPLEVMAGVPERTNTNVKTRQTPHINQKNQKNKVLWFGNFISKRYSRTNPYTSRRDGTIIIKYSNFVESNAAHLTYSLKRLAYQRRCSAKD